MDMLMIDVSNLHEGDVVVVLVKNLQWITLLKIKYDFYEILTNISCETNIFQE
jgi:alanine racemase